MEISKFCCDCSKLKEDCQCPPLEDKLEILTDEYVKIYNENQKLYQELALLKKQSTKREPIILWGD